MTTYIVTAADNTFTATVKHDFHNGFTVVCDTTHEGMNLYEMRTFLAALCEASEVETITVEDLDPKYGSKSTGPVRDMLSMIRY